MDIREKLKQRNNPKKPLKVQLRLKPKIKTKKSVINTIPNVSDSTDAVSLKDTETTAENDTDDTNNKISSFSGPEIIDKTDSNFDIVAFELNMKMAKNPKLSVLGQSPDLKNTLDIKPTVKDEDEDVSDNVEESPALKTQTLINPITLKPKTKRRTRARKTIKPTKLTIPASMIKIGDQPIKQRLPQKPESYVNIKKNAYYLNNRRIFTNFINSLLQNYKKMNDEDFTSKDGSYSLFLHQQIIRDYINIYSPYRGLLLYHGLGAGKTCGSIGIAEGLKHFNKKIFVLTPASLQRNFFEELKKCGDPLYKTNQYWEFINTQNNPHLEQALSETLSLNLKIIRKLGGAWMVHANRKSNYTNLSSEQKKSLDKQINSMIRNKYQFANYNGLRASHIKKLEDDALKNSKFGRKNPFDHKVVIIDEAHNFVSRIVNKLKYKTSLSKTLYDYLMDAIDCRIVFLTGTPIINYPNEIAILFNMLRGYIKTFTFQLETSGKSKIDNKVIINTLRKTSADYIDYKPSTKILTITRNPFGFISKYTKTVKIYKGTAQTVKNDNQYSEQEFVETIITALKKRKEPIYATYKSTHKFKALPDSLKDFNSMFINSSDGTMINKDLFKKRILGLTSYFRSAKESLLPKFDQYKDIIVERIVMSNHQLGIYEIARAAERKEETRNALKRKGNSENIYEDTTSTYRIFSRAFCNFVFPNEIPRPMPSNKALKESISEDKKLDEDAVDNANAKQRLNNMDGRFTAEEVEKIENEIVNCDYETRIKNALKKLQENSDKYLSPEGLDTYSPKFKKMLENIQDIDNNGLHLIYSQFRTLEGIGIFKLVLLENGYSEFKITKNSVGLWQINMTDEELAKPSFVLYTGTEDPDQKEIIRNIYNGDWETIPNSIRERLQQNHQNNNFGEVIKIFMITSSGAEGITLKNTRFVHIMEPYWHPVRAEQVIGRAKRINSHINLNPDFRTVKVFKYLMVFSNIQLYGDPDADNEEDKKPKVSTTLINKDVSKIDKNTPITTDEALFEISNIKEKTIKDILYEIKSSSIDCSIHSSEKENIACFSYTSAEPDEFLYKPNISSEQKDDMSKINHKAIQWEGYDFSYDGIDYIFKPDQPNSNTGGLYDAESYKRAITSSQNPILVGRLIQDPKNPENIIINKDVI